MARPREDQDQLRDQRLNLRLTREERMTLEANAAFAGITPSEFARRRALDYRLPVSRGDRQRRDQMQAQLLRVGNNLNQIAWHANAGRGLPPDLASVIAHLEAVLDSLDDPASDSGGRIVQGGGPLLPP